MTQEQLRSIHGPTAYVVQEHWKSASDHHFDLMVDAGAVLWTWSFSERPDIALERPITGRRIQDHRRRYLTFEGEIGRNLGRCAIWDRGTCGELLQNDGLVILNLTGERLEGTFRLEEGDDTWSLKAE